MGNECGVYAELVARGILPALVPKDEDEDESEDRNPPVTFAALIGQAEAAAAAEAAAEMNAHTQHRMEATATHMSRLLVAMAKATAPIPGMADVVAEAMRIAALENEAPAAQNSASASGGGSAGSQDRFPSGAEEELGARSPRCWSNALSFA